MGGDLRGAKDTSDPRQCVRGCQATAGYSFSSDACPFLVCFNSLCLETRENASFSPRNELSRVVLRKIKSLLVFALIASSFAGRWRGAEPCSGAGRSLDVSVDLHRDSHGWGARPPTAPRTPCSQLRPPCHPPDGLFDKTGQRRPCCPFLSWGCGDRCRGGPSPLCQVRCCQGLQGAPPGSGAEHFIPY